MAEPAQMVFGEVKVQKVGTGGGSRSLEEILEIAERLAQAVRASGPPPLDARQPLYSRLRNEFPEFAETFPVPFRWIVEADGYSRTAMQRYLRWFAKQPKPDAEAYYKAQGEYMVFLYREQLKASAGDPRVGAFRKKIVDQLAEEHKAFVEAAAEVDREHAARETRDGEAKRAALRDLSARLKAQAKAKPRTADGGPGRVG